MARAAVVVSLLVLILATAMAVGAGRASYTAEEVIQAFDREGYDLAEVNGGGWTGYAPVGRSAGTFLFPRPIEQAPFYVLVARSDRSAQEFFAPLAKAGGGPQVFDLLQGNVVVSSDASLTQEGLTAAQRLRIRAAMRALDSST